ncbi:MAG: hypothetical protein COA74_02675 [Gammaproteobacteria bacterium]|nr:MAG: hypothetical protein COA74_02675 [Gammaproteobacteria bacterium]
MTTTAATITEIASDLVAHCKIESEDMCAHDAKIWDKHFAESWTSIEGDGKTFVGRDAVIAKYKEWEAGVICHSCEVTGPFVGQSGFSVIFDLDMEFKDGSFPRSKMKEVANYTVEGGKIVKEEFCYQCPDC